MNRTSSAWQTWKGSGRALFQSLWRIDFMAMALTADSQEGSRDS
jgi:hypothetical protein